MQLSKNDPVIKLLYATPEKVQYFKKCTKIANYTTDKRNGANKCQQGPDSVYAVFILSKKQ